MVICYKFATVKASLFQHIHHLHYYFYYSSVPLFVFHASEYPLPVNSDCSLTSVPTFFIYRIMSDEHNNLDYEFDNQGDSLLEQEEPMEQEVAKQGEKQSEDPVSLLMCSEKDIFDDSQLIGVAKAPTPVDPVVPVRSAETEDALQPAPNFD